MKNLFPVIWIGIFSLSSCSYKNSSSFEETATTYPQEIQDIPSPFESPIKGILQIYLQMKNAFVNGNTSEAASTGKQMAQAFRKFDKSILNEDMKRVFIKESKVAIRNAGLIAANDSNIDNQRSYFNDLSTSMYNLVKVFTADQPIFVDYCPLYNDPKGAIWLSEKTEIRNPYFGSAMIRCGSVKEKLQ